MRFIFGLCAVLCYAVTVSASLQVGTGIYDATGQISDVIFMGMANPSQKGAGLLQRLRSRAFVVMDNSTEKRFCFVSLDSGMVGLVLKNRVLTAVNLAIPGEFYTHDNLAISGTHTHSGPSGFLQDVIFQFAGSLWQEKTLDAMVDGVVQSIILAHNNLEPATGSLSMGDLVGSNINRSPTSYLKNPAEERAKYSGDTDSLMTQVKFTSTKNVELGMINWFAVHPTSLNNTNLLVAGDNKGYASYLFEQYKNGPTEEVQPGHGKFVAAFASTNLGDVSPNTKGPHCRDTGLPCDNLHSTCNGKAEMCSGIGPGTDMYDSCRIIGDNQFQKAKELEHTESVFLQDGVDFAHSYVRMPGLEVQDPDSGNVVGKLCDAAMGDSFAAGTTDGPGMLDFTQGANSSNPLWHFLVDVIHKVSPEQKACQAPKGVLLPTGELNVPFAWAANILPVQILRVGQLVMLVVPSEFTTMAGRRIREKVKARMVEKGILATDGVVILSGLANNYADYTATYEEYQAQRYEAASTIYGPHQLNAYIQEFMKLVDSMAAGTKPDVGPIPEDFSKKIPWHGDTPSGDCRASGVKSFGQVLKQPAASYTVGSTVVATFAGAGPINNFRTQTSYMQVLRCDDPKCAKTTVVAVDGDWETRILLHKARCDLILHSWQWELHWTIPPTAKAGTYMIKLLGTSYTEIVITSHHFKDFTGQSQPFTVQASGSPRREEYAIM